MRNIFDDIDGYNLFVFLFIGSNWSFSGDYFQMIFQGYFISRNISDFYINISSEWILPERWWKEKTKEAFVDTN